MKGEHSAMPDAAVAHYHLPGLFEFYDFYRAFLPLYRRHREYFTIGAILHLCMARRRAAFGAADGSGPGTAIPGTFWL